LKAEFRWIVEGEKKYLGMFVNGQQYMDCFSSCSDLADVNIKIDTDRESVLLDFFHDNFDSEVYWDRYVSDLGTGCTTESIMKEVREDKDLKLSLEMKLINLGWFDELEEYLKDQESSEPAANKDEDEFVKKLKDEGWYYAEETLFKNVNNKSIEATEADLRRLGVSRVYLDEHPEGADRGGHVPYAESEEGFTARYDMTGEEWC